MMSRLAFYFVEALLLALVGCGALFVVRSALHRLGWNLKPRWPWVYAGVWGLLLALGIAGGELAWPGIPVGVFAGREIAAVRSAHVAGFVSAVALCADQFARGSTAGPGTGG